MSIPKNLNTLVLKQLSNFFEIENTDQERISLALPLAYKKCLDCFNQINNKYYSTFNSTHSGQYAVFLYYLGHEIYLGSRSNETSDKLYYLNKIMHSLDLYYEVKLPEVFFWEHPVGTVLGRGTYSNFFTIYQNCTIGGSADSHGKIFYPELAENVTLYSYACVLGKSRIGKNTIISSHAFVINQDIPDNSIVFGQGKDLIIKPNARSTNIFKTISSKEVL